VKKSLWLLSEVPLSPHSAFAKAAVDKEAKSVGFVFFCRQSTKNGGAINTKSELVLRFVTL